VTDGFAAVGRLSRRSAADCKFGLAVGCSCRGPTDLRRSLFSRRRGRAPIGMALPLCSSSAKSAAVWFSRAGMAHADWYCYVLLSLCVCYVLLMPICRAGARCLCEMRATKRLGCAGRQAGGLPGACGWRSPMPGLAGYGARGLWLVRGCAHLSTGGLRASACFSRWSTLGSDRIYFVLIRLMAIEVCFSGIVEEDRSRWKGLVRVTGTRGVTDIYLILQGCLYYCDI